MLARRSRAIWSMTAAPEIPADRVAAQRKGQAGVLQPPGAEVGPEVKPGVGVGELALVDQQADIHVAPVDRVLDLVERDHDLDHVGLVELEREVGGGEHAGDAHPEPAERGPGVGRAAAVSPPAAGRTRRPSRSRSRAGRSRARDRRRRGSRPP